MLQIQAPRMNSLKRWTVLMRDSQEDSPGKPVTAMLPRRELLNLRTCHVEVSEGGISLHSGSKAWQLEDGRQILRSKTDPLCAFPLCAVDVPFPICPFTEASHTGLNNYVETMRSSLFLSSMCGPSKYIVKER